MTKVDSDWQKSIVARFEGRENLTKEQLYTHYFETLGLPKNEVFDCLGLIEFEYDFPVGLLRPEDKLEKLIKPVSTRNPWRWLVYRTHEGDSESELDYELGKRMRIHGTVGSWAHIKEFSDLTFGDFIKAWCGRTPTDNSVR